MYQTLCTALKALQGFAIISLQRKCSLVKWPLNNSLCVQATILGKKAERDFGWVVVEINHENRNLMLLEIITTEIYKIFLNLSSLCGALISYTCSNDIIYFLAQLAQPYLFSCLYTFSYGVISFQRFSKCLINCIKN